MARYDLLSAAPPRGRLAQTMLRVVDRFLAGRGEERAAVLLDFAEIPVPFDEDEFQAIAGSDAPEPPCKPRKSR